MPKLFRYIPKLTRLAAFLAIASGLVLLATLNAARAHMHDGMQALARQLMPYAEQGVMESPRRVLINGEALYLAVGTTPDDVPAVLDYYEQRCRRAGSGLTEHMTRAAQRTARLDALPANQLWARGQRGRRAESLETLRIGDDESGYVACFDTGGRPLSMEEITRRLQAMSATGNLAEFGDLRYAWVAKSDTGTRIITVATDGRFNLLRMFPTEGDAPGSDIANLPRFPAMRRVLSAHEEGRDYALGLYATRAPREQVRGWYRRELPRLGWRPLEMPRDRRFSPEVERHRNTLTAFERGNTTLVLVFDEAEGTTSMMTLAGM